MSDRYRYILPGDIDSDFILEVEDDDIMGHIYTSTNVEISVKSQEFDST